MDRLGAMAAFVCVVDEGSFSSAARSLRLSTPSVTRAVASLEDHLGTQLLTRTTRKLALTESGRRYVEDCRRILAEVSNAESHASGAFVRPTGTLHVTAPMMFGHLHVLPVLCEFLDLHPAVRARTLLLDRVVDLIDEGMDVAVRIGALPDSSLRALRLGFVRRVLVASPAYLEHHGPLDEPDDLLHHDVVAVTRSQAGTVEWGFEQARVTLTPRLACNTIEAGLRAAEAGWGVVRLYSYQVHESVRAGRLVRLLAHAEPDPDPVQLVHVDARHTSAKLRAFLDFASVRLRERIGEIAEVFSAQ